MTRSDESQEVEDEESSADAKTGTAFTIFFPSYFSSENVYL
jgi:hypothetical protein